MGVKTSLPLCPRSCGSCKRSQPCSPVDGFCLACQPGWNGTLCKEPCAPGFHGEDCLQPCPRCRHGEVCDPETGSCPHCEPGWMGPRYAQDQATGPCGGVPALGRSGLMLRSLSWQLQQLLPRGQLW